MSRIGKSLETERYYWLPGAEEREWEVTVHGYGVFLRGAEMFSN